MSIRIAVCTRSFHCAHVIVQMLVGANSNVHAPGIDFRILTIFFFAEGLKRQRAVSQRAAVSQRTAVSESARSETQHTRSHTRYARHSLFVLGGGEWMLW